MHQLTEKGWDDTMTKEDINDASSMRMHSTLKKHVSMEMGTAEEGLMLNTEIQASDVRQRSDVEQQVESNTQNNDVEVPEAVPTTTMKVEAQDAKNNE